MKIRLLCAVSVLVGSIAWSALPACASVEYRTVPGSLKASIKYVAVPTGEVRVSGSDLLPKALRDLPPLTADATDWNAFFRDHGDDPDVAALLKDHGADPRLPGLLKALPRLGWWLNEVYRTDRPVLTMTPQAPGVIQLLPTPPHPPSATLKSGLLVYTPEDRRIFRTMHPLLTPDVPIVLSPVQGSPH